MLDPAVYTWRLQTFCHGCEWWAGRCRKGHLTSSPEGCPVHKFPPVEAAGYAPDLPPAPVEASGSAAPCGSCGSSAIGELPDLSWHQVLSHFGASMLKWVSSGLSLVSEAQHAERYNLCKSCPHYRGFWCTKCRCVAYAKTQLATEECPDNPPRWGKRA